MATRLPEPTPEMIAAGADALEHVNGIGRWLAESLATSVLQRAFEAHQAATVSKAVSPRPGDHVSNSAGAHGDAMCWCGKTVARHCGCHPNYIGPL